MHVLRKIDSRGDGAMAVKKQRNIGEIVFKSTLFHQLSKLARRLMELILLISTNLKIIIFGYEKISEKHVREAFGRIGYDIISVIEDGKRSVMYKARERKTTDIVAVKFERIDSDNKMEERAIIRIRENLGENDYFVSIREYGEIAINGDVHSFIIMDYFDGVTLTESIRNGSMQTWNHLQLLDVLFGILDAIIYIENKGERFTDITLTNILINMEMHLAIVDYESPSKLSSMHRFRKKLKGALSQIVMLSIEKKGFQLSKEAIAQNWIGHSHEFTIEFADRLFVIITDMYTNNKKYSEPIQTRDKLIELSHKFAIPSGDGHSLVESDGAMSSSQQPETQFSYIGNITQGSIAR